MVQPVCGDLGAVTQRGLAPSHPLSLSPSTACQRLKSWPSSLQQPSMTMSTQALPTASTSRLSEGWGVAGQEGLNGSGEVARISMMTFGFAGQNVPSCTMTAQCWRITTSALFSE